MAGYTQKQLSELLEETEREHGAVDFFNVSRGSINPETTAAAWGIPLSEQTRPVPYVKAKGVEGFAMLNENEDYPKYHLYGEDAFTEAPVLSHSEKPLTASIEHEAKVVEEHHREQAEQQRQQKALIDAECRSLIDGMSFINQHFGEVFNIDKHRADAADNQRQFLRKNMFTKHILGRYTKSFESILNEIELKEGNLDIVSDLTDIAEGTFIKDMVKIDAALSEKLALVRFGFAIERLDNDDQTDFVLRSRNGTEMARVICDADVLEAEYGHNDDTVTLFDADEHAEHTNYGKPVPLEESPLKGLVDNLCQYAYLNNFDGGALYDDFMGEFEVRCESVIENGSISKLLLKDPDLVKEIQAWERDQVGQVIKQNTNMTVALAP